jgi:hypothetical protein
MWKSRTKNDLMIEVWEALDCENIGAKEIITIEQAVREQFGESAVDSPMVIARLLADEGAELRHSEIMRLFVERNQEGVFDALFRNILKFESFEQAVATIRDLENIRNRFLEDEDIHGLRILREVALQAKKDLLAAADKPKTTSEIQARNAEIVSWLTIWLRTPDVFENWIKLRMRSPDFEQKFGGKG